MPAFHRLQRRAPRALAARAALDLDPRHQAQRGRARADLGALRDAATSGAPPLDALGAAATAATRREVDGEPAPDRNEEYLLYQMLLGAWPLGRRLDDEARAAFVGRIQEYMAKATKEAKVHTSWINPNEAYDDGDRSSSSPRSWIRREAGLPAPTSRAFQRLIARIGAVNSLAQTLLKLTAPGVPDIYQGNELWDFSLVDPDNRRPVDYRLRQRQLATPPAGAPSAARRGGDGPRLARSLADEWTDGRIKQYVTWRALDARRQHPDLFRDGAYLPLAVDGGLREHVCRVRARA